MDDPHYYSYYFLNPLGELGEGVAAPTDGSANFTAFAYGDLDCDETYSTFFMYGEVNEVYSDGPAGSAKLEKNEELE
jgi:hypothetical protein